MKNLTYICLSATLSLVAGAQDSAIAYDILIKGGTVYDGSTSAPVVTDIAIQGNKIVDIGNLEGRAGKVISANGYLVAPGFIDIHDHSDNTITGIASGGSNSTINELRGHYNALYQGITTVVTGNCGEGATDTAKLFRQMQSMKYGTNVMLLVGHGSLRQELFNTLSGKLSASQLEKFKTRIEKEMQNGACGFSTGLAYTPAIENDEILELAKVVHKHGGFYATHMRDETGWQFEDGKISLLEAIKEAIDVGRKTGISVQISHLKLSAPFTIQPSRALEVIEAARQEGLDVTADSYPYTAGASTFTVFLPAKFKGADGGIAAKYKTSEGRKELKAAVEKIFANVSPDKLTATRVLKNASQEVPEYQGKTLQEIASLMNLTPLDCYIKLICDYTVEGILNVLSEEAMKTFMQKPYVFTCSDGTTWAKANAGAHPRFYGAFTRKLKHFAIDEKWISISEAIASMTQGPAKKLGLSDRGKIEKGAVADLVVLDPATLADNATYENPTEFAAGAVHVLVNGTFAIENRKLTGKRAGQPIKGKGLKLENTEEEGRIE